MTAKQVRLREDTMKILDKYNQDPTSPVDPNTAVIRMDAMIETYRRMYPGGER